jgi:hypothetical protein
MPSAAVSDAVTARLAGFTTCPVYTINQQLTPPVDGGPYVQVQYPFGDERQISIGAPGANIFREEGGIRFVIFTPVGDGIGSAQSIAASLRTLFRNFRSGAFRCYAAAPVTFDDTNDRPGWFVSSFAVPYEFDLIT